MKRISREDTVPFTTQEDMQEDAPFQLHVTIEDELIMKEDAEEIRQKGRKRTEPADQSSEGNHLSTIYPGAEL